MPHHRVFVALGSNVEPEIHLPAAVEGLRQQFGELRLSPLYRSAAVGSSGPPFHNAAVVFATALEPRHLKYRVLRPLEESLGRVRQADRNAPRTIDLDIALHGDLVVSEAGLRIPDPEILTRAHVALPLADLAPQLVHPVDGRPLAEIAAPFRHQAGVERLP
ncbi:MAG: 2-amino-4-hydroxy-6-hydroxymethyldihydropteridine diphosphokinase [Acidobacteriota bacterium]